jgi:hypothetical protein
MRARRNRPREDDYALATPLLDPLAQDTLEPEPRRSRTPKRHNKPSSLLESAPDKAGGVEIASLHKRNIIFGGYTWRRRFLAISGELLSIFQRRLHCGCTYKYILCGKYNLGTSHVSVQTDRSAKGQPRTIVSLSDNHGQIWLKIRTRNAAAVSSELSRLLI